MKYTRIHADTSGDSHFADVEIPLQPAGPIGHLSAPIPATALIFRSNDPAYDYDWHVAPRRQFIILLDGASIEIETSDGQRRTFNPGDILLVEDTTGKGHRSKHTTPTPRHSLFIALDKMT